MAASLVALPLVDEARLEPTETLPRAANRDLEWIHEVADPSRSTGNYPSIDLADSRGNPAIAYQDIANGTLKFAYRDASSWRTEVAGQPGETALFPDLEVDASRTTISYAVLGAARFIKFAERRNETWTSTTIWSGGTTGWSSTTTDESGRRYVAFGGRPEGLLLASEGSPNWTVTRVATPIGVDGVSLAYRDGVFGIGYVESDPSGLGVAHVLVGAGSSWTSYRLSAQTGPSISLDFGSDRSVHVVVGVGTELVYYSLQNGTWIREFVDSGNYVGAIHIYLSLHVGGDDRPRVAYLDTSEYRLMFAEREPSGWIRSEVHRVINRGFWPSLAVDATGRPHLAYLDLGWPEPTGNLWYSTTKQQDGPLESEIDVDPDTLNPRSRGRWVTVYIELPAGHDPRDIDAATVRMNGVLAPVLDPKYGFVTDPAGYIVDHDGDGVWERMVKFDREHVAAILPVGVHPVRITGRLADGIAFSGLSDPIRVLP